MKADDSVSALDTQVIETEVIPQVVMTVPQRWREDPGPLLSRVAFMIAMTSLATTVLFTFVYAVKYNQIDWTSLVFFGSFALTMFVPSLLICNHMMNDEIRAENKRREDAKIRLDKMLALRTAKNAVLYRTLRLAVMDWALPLGLVDTATDLPQRIMDALAQHQAELDAQQGMSDVQVEDAVRKAQKEFARANSGS